MTSPKISVHTQALVGIGAQRYWNYRLRRTLARLGDRGF
jgi:hypothetical protein